MQVTSDPVDAVLQPAERVLWRGQPLTRILFSLEDIFMVPFSLVWGGGAFLWEGNVLQNIFSTHAQKPPLFFVIWGIPFMCAGFYMIVGRFLHLVWLKKRTWYAVTDKRVLVVSERASGRTVLEQDLVALTGINRRVRRDGAGSIMFPSRMPLSVWPIQRLGALAFIDIADVNQVYDLLQKARAS